MTTYEWLLNEHEYEESTKRQFSSTWDSFGLMNASNMSNLTLSDLPHHNCNASLSNYSIYYCFASFFSRPVEYSKQLTMLLLYEFYYKGNN